MKAAMAFAIGDDRWRYSIPGLVVIAALLNAGCYKATGGGWIPTSEIYITGGDRASFGFSAMCNTTTLPDGTTGAALYGGQLEWQDGFVQFHGDVEPFDFMVLPGRCQDVRSMLTSRGGPLPFGGSYRPHSGGDSGFFLCTVNDLGTPGANGDSIQIGLTDGEYAGYANAGTLEGGNIQVF
jgi:hypothetical protein